MKKLDIAITKATLQSFSVDAHEGKPVVTVTLALMTAGGKKITTYSIDNHSWRDDPLDIDITMLPLIGDLARKLEGAAVRHCKDSQLALPAPKAKETTTDKVALKNFPNVPDGTVVTLDTPINLDDIPF